MHIQLHRLASCDLPHYPAYVAADLHQVEKVCSLLGTTHTVWSNEQVDRLRQLATKGQFNLLDTGHTVTITLPGVNTELSRGDTVSLLEVARIALRDADMFDQCADEMDLSDEEMIRLRDLL